MAKMQLKKPILLQEEFAAGEVSNPNQNATPTVQTTSTTVGIDKTSTGDEVRAEIVKDVDTILTNLEALSKQITEDVDRQYNALIESLENETPLNEDFMETMMKAFTDMKNYGVVKASYPAKKKSIMNAEVAKASALAEFDDKMAGKEEELIQKLKDAWKEKITKAGQQFADNLPKKKQAQEKLRGMRDANVEAAKTGSIKKKIDAKKTALTTKQDSKIKKLQDKLAEVEKDFPISADGVLGKQWAIEKGDINTNISIKTIELKTKAETEYMDDPEKVKAKMERDEERTKKKAQEGKENAKEFADELKAAEAKAKDAELAAANDPTKKPAVEAVKNFFGASKSYIDALSSIDASEEIPEDQQKLLKDTKKKYSEAKTALTKSKMVDAGYAKDNDEGEELITTLTTNVTKAVDAYKDVAVKADALADEANNKKQEKLNGLKDELKELKATLAAAGEPGTEEEPNQEYDNAKAAVDAKQGEIDALNTVEDSVQIEELQEGRKTVDSSAFGDDKLGYNDQFRGNTSLSQSLASDLGFDPKKPWSEGLGFDDQAMYSVGKPEGTIANDALSGKYTYAELLAMAKDHFGIKESEEIEEIEEGNEFGAARAEAIAKGEKTFKVGDEEYPVEDVSKDDKENAEEFVEEAKEELPKKVKLYEGMSVADKFKALM